MQKKRTRRPVTNRELRKIWKIMRLSVFFLFFFVAQAFSTSTYSQQKLLTLKMQGAKVIDVLNKIESESEFFFLFNQKLLDVDRQVNIVVKNESIGNILSEIFEKTNVTYMIKDRQIILTTATSGIGSDQGQQRSVKGKVTDQSGASLPGVSVVVKGTTTGVITDNNGNFSLGNVPENSVLRFSFVGMKTQEIMVYGKSSISVTLIEDAIGLEEVVAVGYGTQKKENLTGAINKVSFDVVENRPIKNVGEGLQGVIPNLNITIPNGKPSSQPIFNIRGYTSINGGTPLIIVDGTPMEINMINFEDVESITVLKDASSAAIYGARASYGVIIVTTKSGKVGEPKINYKSNFQLSSPTKMPEFIDSYPLALETNSAWKMKTGAPLYTDQQVQWIKAYYEDPKNTPVYHIGSDKKIFWNGNFDPIKRLLKDWYSGQKQTISMSGGTQKMSYYASADYQKNNGILALNTDVFKQYNTFLKLENSIKKWFKLGVQLSYNKNNYDEPFPYLESQSGTYSYFPGRGTTPSYHLVKNWRNFPVGAPLFTTDDMPCGGGIPIGETDAEYNSGGRQISTGVNSYIKIYNTITLLNGLKINTDFSYNNTNSFVKGEKIPVDFIMYDFVNFSNGWTAPGYIARQYDNKDYYTFNAYANYEKQFNKHYFNGIIGFNQEWVNYSSLWGQSNDIISKNLPVMKLSSGTQYANDSEGHSAIRGSFFRLSYNYNQKYLVEVNGRYDGTSKFPKKSRFAYFPSFSAGWRISEENFFEPVKKVINYAKLRSSYGSLGNQNVANYFYIPTMSVNSQVNYLLGTTRPLGVNNPGLVSADLTWETTTTLNFGVDMSLWNKVNLSYDWFQRSTTDMLTAGQALPALLGTSVPAKNNADMKTVGWEFSVGWDGKNSRGLGYNVNFVLSDYQGTITSFDGNPNKLNTTYYKGQKIGEIWGYQTVGLFQNIDEVENAPSQNQLGNSGKWAPGEVRYADLNDDKVINWGDNTVSNPGDKRIIGNSTPRYSFGLNSKIQYKNFDLAVLFQGIGKKDIMPAATGDNGLLYWGLIAQRFSNVRKEFYENRWSENNPNAYYPISNMESTWNRLPQTRYLQSGAYIRLKNLSIGYTVPKRIIDKINISKLYIYLSGQNLWVYTKLPDGFDPESLQNQDTFTGMEYPVSRVFSLGLNLTL